MPQHLTIHDFGPIHEAEITVRDLTVFIGPQATGKSLTAQLYCFFSSLEEVLAQLGETIGDYSPSEKTNSQTRSPSKDTPGRLEYALKWWLGNPLKSYLRSDSFLSYNPMESAGRGGQGIHWRPGKTDITTGLRRRATSRALKRKGSNKESEVYIPAGRAIYSFVPPSTAIRLFSRPSFQERWPGYISMFYSELGEAIERLWRSQPIGSEQPTFYDAQHLHFLGPRIEKILKGSIRYGREGIQLSSEGRLFQSSTIAAGQMDIWPFWTIIRDRLNYERMEGTRIYFEEPEAHLHPKAQWGIMEILAYLVNCGGKFLITTHSPYVLYALNNFLMAQKVLAKGESLPNDVPSEVGLRPEQVGAYRFSSAGKVKDILNPKSGLIDEDELDRVADELGASFTQMQEEMED